MPATAEKVKNTQEKGFVPGKMTKRCYECRTWIEDDKDKCPNCGCERIFTQPYMPTMIGY